MNLVIYEFVEFDTFTPALQEIILSGRIQVVTRCDYVRNASGLSSIFR